MISTKRFIDILEDSCWVRRRDFPNGVSCYNFTRDAFQEGHWDEATKSARGFFVKDGKIIARGFNKFFELQESDIPNLTFPVRYDRKENGYLGILSTLDGSLFYATKGYCGDDSMLVNDFQFCVEEHVMGYADGNFWEIEDFLIKHNCSAVFEVIPGRNQHIVDYHDKNHKDIDDVPPGVILLSLISNTVEGEELPQSLVEEFSYLGDFDTPDIVCPTTWFYYRNEVNSCFLNEEELREHLPELINEDDVEGVVLTDAAGKKYKVKTTWYREWKRIRGRIPRISKNGGGSHWAQQYKEFVKINTYVVDMVLNTMAPAFYAETGHYIDVISLRNIYHALHQGLKNDMLYGGSNV